MLHRYKTLVCQSYATILLGIVYLCFGNYLFAQTAFTSVQNGNWNDASTWTLGAGAGGTEGIDYPSASDIVTIDHFVIINATNNGSNFSFTGELTINAGDTLESQVGDNVAGFVLEGNGIMRNFGSFFTLDATEEPDPNAHIPYEFVCKDNSIFIGGLNSFAFISDDWNIQDNAQIFVDNLLCYAVSDDVIFNGSACNMYGSGNIRIGGDGANSNVEFVSGATNAQLDDNVTIWRNVSANDCSGTSVSTGTSTAILPPFALDDSYTTVLNTAQVQFVLTEELDDFSPVDADTLTLISVGNNAAINDGNTSLGGTVSINNNGTASDPTDDYVDYSPPNGVTGTDTYSYIINNKAGGADTAVVTVTIVSSITDKDGDGVDNATDVDDDNDGILDADECGGTVQKTVFTYTGADQFFTVPAAATSLTAKIWGAGGRGDTQSGRGTGGAGGYTTITINTASLTSTNLIITVGEGGGSGTDTTYGNGGSGLADGSRNYGSGGGMSAITYTTLANPSVLSDADLVAIAGGGGTAAAFTNVGSQAGEGGGTTGGNATDSDPTTGGGGTQSAGGTTGAGGNAGSFLLGGDAVTDGGAGGGGYYGGGSGYVTSGDEGLGGGGSGYVSPSATSSTTTAGSAQTPPNTGDADYVAGVGVGGNNSGGSGGNGLVVIEVTVSDCDTDNDGVINSCDLDSDNDGIADIIEAGGVDTNGDGLVDVSTDTDGDGYANTFDSDNSGTALTLPDTDGDGLANSIDIDSDADGIVDVIEAQASGTISTPTGSDSDGDGIDDGFDPDNGNSLLSPVNTDGTDNPDYTDTNSDNDNDPDALEAYDTDNDGVANTTASGSDTDGDGLDDSFDNVAGLNASTNVTNNGQTSASFPNLDNIATAELDWREIEDKDGDGVEDDIDIDDDNDGILDEVECGGPNVKTTFSYTGSDQVYNVPAQATSLLVKLWGAGGRGDEQGSRGVGGAGGYTEFTIATDQLISSSIIVMVGEGGNSVLARTYGNGGSSSQSTVNGATRNFGSGGGMSAISYVTLDVADPSSIAVSNLLAIAGGGGSMPAFSNASTNAGEGGGTTGGTATDGITAINGGGGTQSAGGTSNGNAGAYLLGGNSVLNGSSGGGGYYGGGSGAFSSGNEGGGGGGSGYISSLGSGTLTQGSVQTPPNTADADYVSGVGEGGDNGGDNGGNGLVVIEAVFASCDDDGDGLPNSCDLDSDNDGIQDIIEAGGADSNNDGVVDDATDTDGDGWADTFDSDNMGTALTNPDTDGDGLNNFRDADSDSDGLTDNVEGQTTAAFVAPLGTDTDGDGWDDRYDSDNGGTAITLSNNDGVGNPDYADVDADGDGLNDWIEGFDDNTSGDALDDLITRATAFETAAGSPGFYVNSNDSDMDGIPNWLEDDDGDGLRNFLDPDNGNYYDTDSDGIVDLYDANNNGSASALPNADGDAEPDFRDTDNQVTLPISLVTFAATKEGNSVRLDWVTESEINNDYFTIERGANLFDFEAILTAKGAENSQSQKQYTLYDHAPLEGANYYRLRQTDFDGQSEVFAPRFVFFSRSKDSRLIIYPNPNYSQQLNLLFDVAAEGNYTVQLISIEGALLQQKNFSIADGVEGEEQRYQINLEAAAGMYLLKVIGPQFAEEVKYIVK